jgi:hypothetical protein
LLPNEQSCGNQDETSATTALLRKTHQSERSHQPPPGYVLRASDFAPLARRSFE